MPTVVMGLGPKNDPALRAGSILPKKRGPMAVQPDARMIRWVLVSSTVMSVRSWALRSILET
jgi:hypothetical protein